MIETNKRPSLRIVPDGAEIIVSGYEADDYEGGDTTIVRPRPQLLPDLVAESSQEIIQTENNSVA